MSTDTGSPQPTVDATWASLVSRSMQAWDTIKAEHEIAQAFLPRDILLKCKTLEEFLLKSIQCSHFWFFQLRSSFMSQKRLMKWSPNRLKEYVILPAMPGLVLRTNCFFLSHYWRSKEDPDPGGDYLRLCQAELQVQSWSYIWVDWTCMPQDPRTELEAQYFERCLRTMAWLIRNCGFMYYYPPFEPRLWILYEVAEYMLTCESPMLPTEDAQSFVQHTHEMLEVGVQPVLSKYGYNCTQDRDKQYLTSWLELLVLLKRLKLPTLIVRVLMDTSTWGNPIGTLVNNILLRLYDGTLTVDGVVHKFTPFPQWV